MPFLLSAQEVLKSVIFWSLSSWQMTNRKKTECGPVEIFGNFSVIF